MERVNDHYNSNPSTSFSDLLSPANLSPTAPEFGQFLTVDQPVNSRNIDGMSPRNSQEDTFFDAEELHVPNLAKPNPMPSQTQEMELPLSNQGRSPSLSKALSRVRESILGVNSQFECPVCFEEMKPPVKMFHCRQGHVVCQNCLVEGHLKECPSCRGPIIGRNFAMEKLAESYFSNFDVIVK